MLLGGFLGENRVVKKVVVGSRSVKEGKLLNKLHRYSNVRVFNPPASFKYIGS